MFPYSFLYIRKISAGNFILLLKKCYIFFLPIPILEITDSSLFLLSLDGKFFGRNYLYLVLHKIIQGFFPLSRYFVLEGNSTG